jgi:MFS family permease
MVIFGQLSAPVQRSFRVLVDDRSVYTPVRSRPDDLGDESLQLSGWRGIDPNVTLLGLTSMFTDLASEMVTSVIPLYLTLLFGFTQVQLGAFDGLYRGMAAITALWAALIADKRRRHKEVAVVGYSMSTVSRLGLLIAQSWVPIVGFLYVDRLGKGIRTAPRDALISLSSAKARLAESFGVHRALDTAGAVAGPVVASLILSQNATGYRSVFVCSFFASCIGLGVLVFFVRNKRDAVDETDRVASEAAEPARPHVSVRTALGLLRDRRFAAILAVAVTVALVVPGDALLYFSYARQADLAPALFPLLYAGASVGFLLLAVPLGRLADRVGRARVFVAGQAMLFCVFALLGAGLAGLAPLLLMLLLYGGFYAATDGILTAMASAVLPRHLRTTGLALVGTLVALANLISAVGWGAIWQRWGIATASHVFMVGLLLSIVAGIVLLRPTRTAADVSTEARP